MPAWLAWLLVAAGFGVAEVLTLGLVLGMIGAAALVAAITAAAGAAVTVQVAVFVLVTPLLLGGLRPLARRHLHSAPGARTGVDALIGQRALVLAPVDGHDGRVRIGGEVWSARAYDETQRIPAGATVDVIAIEGATALVYAHDSEPA